MKWKGGKGPRRILNRGHYSEEGGPSGGYRAHLGSIIRSSIAGVYAILTLMLEVYSKALIVDWVDNMEGATGHTEDSAFNSL